MIETDNARRDARMSGYEAKAWSDLLDRVAKNDQRKKLAPVAKANELVDLTATKVGEFLDDHENLQKVVDGLGRPVNGLQDLLSRGAEASISSERLTAKAAKLDARIKKLDDMQLVDVRIPDSLLTKRALKYGTVLGVEGAASSLVVSGLVVASTVSGGTTMAAAAAAISTDIAVNLAAATRVVTKIAMTYGYDATMPDERVYLLGVLNYGTTVTPGSKVASLAQLSRLTQAMMRNPTHRQLERWALVRLTRAFYKALGFRLTHQRLAQAIPIAGAFINAGINVGAITLLNDRAQDAYRLRFLTEKYGLDPADWLSNTSDSGEAVQEEDVIDLEKLLVETESDGDGVPGGDGQRSS